MENLALKNKFLKPKKQTKISLVVRLRRIKKYVINLYLKSLNNRFK